MWTNENGARMTAAASDLTDEGWALICQLISPAKRGGNRSAGLTHFSTKTWKHVYCRL